MTTVVISQPMLFPWVGMFEQIRLADVYVHFDDVPFSKGSFTNRVQLKTARGTEWMTIPLQDLHLGQLIRDVRASSTRPWRERHLDVLRRHYDEAPFRDEALAIVEEVYGLRDATFCEIVMASMDRVKAYFGLRPDQRVLLSSRDLAIPGKGSDRVLAMVKALGGTRYVSGLGGRNYLDHERFEREGVRVEYMKYERVPYPQRFGPFTPYVSVLDLIANCGREGAAVIRSGTIDWRQVGP